MCFGLMKVAAPPGPPSEAVYRWDESESEQAVAVNQVACVALAAATCDRPDRWVEEDVT